MTRILPLLLLTACAALHRELPREPVSQDEYQSTYAEAGRVPGSVVHKTLLGASIDMNGPGSSSNSPVFGSVTAISPTGTNFLCTGTTGYCIANSAGTGMFTNGSSAITFYIANSSVLALSASTTDGVAWRSSAANAADGVIFLNEAEIQWPNTKIAEVGTDIVFSGGILFKNNAVRIDPAVGLYADEAFLIRTDPTVTACSGGTAASITSANSTVTGIFDVGTACAGESTAVLTLPAAATGWTCKSDNRTTADRYVKQTASTTTSATMTNITISTGATTNWTDGDDVDFICMGY